MQRANLQLQAVSNGPGFSPIRDHAEHLPGFEDLFNGHGDGLYWHVTDSLKPTFADLLAAARLVEFHNEIRFLRVEVGWRIVKSEVTVLPDANESCINGLARNQLADSPAFSRRIRSIAV